MKKAARTNTARRVPLMQICAICLATYMALFSMLYFGLTPEQYDIQVGVPAPIQILATKEVQDTVTTEALREAAASAVEPSYKSVDPTIITDVLASLSEKFDALRSLRADTTAAAVRDYSDDALGLLNASLGLTLTRDQLAALIEADDTTVENLFADATSEVRGTLRATLPEGQETVAIQSIRTELIKNYTSQLTGLAMEAVRTCIRPNMLIDEEITEANRAKARESVEPKICVQGQVIVREGEIVTLAQYTMISSLGLLAEDSFDFPLLIGVMLLVLLMMLSIGFYLWHFNRAILASPKMMALLNLILVITIGLSLILSVISAYLIPVALGFLLAALLLDMQLALFLNFIIALPAALLISSAGSGMYAVFLTTAIVGPVVSALFARRQQRTTTLIAGGIIAAINFAGTFIVGLVNSANLSTTLNNSFWAAGGGVLSAVFCIAIQPLLEWIFNLATASKLIELSNPNQPLLRRLLLEASGTYHHSIIVANLAEAGCSAIGGNGLLARVGAYYHDVGKLKRPLYFKENQMGDNPHDRTDPRVSTAILIAHPRDGAQMAQKARIPKPVVDIIREHHGDTPVIYFYDKAKKLYGEDQVDISAFRYEGPRPQTRESAIVALADSVEAATRSLPNPDPEKIDALIRKIVHSKLNDGQLDNSSLTFSDLEKICAAFSTVLTGVFHERIEYPDVAIPPRTEKAEVAESKPKSAQNASETTAEPSKEENADVH